MIKSKDKIHSSLGKWSGAAKSLWVFAVALAGFALNARGNDVKEITDPAMYSAGNMPAAAIAKWLAENIKPENYDIWHGKKQRIDLNGAWKLIKLDGTKDSPDNDYGEKNGFAAENFDDSKWPSQPVPWQWNWPFPEPKRWLKTIFGGIGWYRTKVNIPADLKGSQVILCFTRVDYEATVYVNGHKAGFNKNLLFDHGLSLPGRYDGFEINATPFVKFGEDNSIAVKVYDDGLYASGEAFGIGGERRYGMPGMGGIWQEVFLEKRPPVYSRVALVTPNVKTGSVQVKAIIENTTGKELAENLAVTLGPWRSQRYNLAEGVEERSPIGKFALRPGENAIRFEVKLKVPHLWDIDHPWLYHMTLINENGMVLGQERFGFRDFTPGENLFSLNGKDIFLMSETQSMYECLGFEGPIGAGNSTFLRKGHVERFVDAMKGENYNMLRDNGTMALDKIVERCDEVGLLLYEEEPNNTFILDMNEYYDIKTGILTEFFKEKIRKTAYAAYNNPAVVIRSMGNERYDSCLIHRKDMPSFAPLLSAMIAEYKKYDLSRPITSSSGRAPTDASCGKVEAIAPLSTAYAPCDFNDIHNYGPCWNPPVERGNYDNFTMAFHKLYKAYELDAGKKAPLLNGESGATCVWSPNHGFSAAQIKALAPRFKNGKFDKAWLLSDKEAINYIKGVCLSQQCFFSDLVTLEKRETTNMLYFKNFIEWQRTLRRWIAGYEINESLRSKNARDALPGELFDQVKQANQPVTAVLDNKFNRNMIAGGKDYAAEIFAINDSRKTIASLTVRFYLRSLDGKSGDVDLGAFKTEELAPAGMEKRKLTFKVPAAVPTGHYQARLAIGGAGVSAENFFARPLFILNNKDIAVALPATASKTAVYAPAETEGVKQLEAVLAGLKIPFARIDNLEKAKDFDLAIVPPMTYREQDVPSSPAFAEWLTAGGRLLCLEQSTRTPALPGKTIPTAGRGFQAELMEPEHPAFNGLVQRDFILWNSDDKENFESRNLFRYAIVPADMGALALDFAGPSKFGMGLAEYKFAKGKALFSQFEALRRFNDDSVATKYFINLLNYALNDWDGRFAYNAKFPSATEKKTDLEIDAKKAFFVDLRPFANMAFKDEVGRDGKGGWTDNGPDKDMRQLPVGKQVFRGVPFEIVDPDGNGGKSCVVLRGSAVSRTDFLPAEIKRAPVDKKVKKLFFLVASDWTPSEGKIGAFNLGFGSGRGSGGVDGAFHALEAPLIAGKNIDNWKVDFEAPVPQFAIPGWVGQTGRSADVRKEARSYIIEWENPEPDRPILYFDFLSEKKATLVLLAVTGEER